MGSISKEFRDFININIKENYSVSELAEISGVSSSTISRILNGYVTPDTKTMEKVLKPLGYQLAIVELECL